MRSSLHTSAKRSLRVACLALLLSTGAAFAQTTMFTYQGRLTDGGTPANGPYDMEFKLYDALTLGNLQGSPNTLTKTGVNVASGIFTVQLDFGASAFPGADRFLDIGVKHPADSSYTPLLPRQQLTSTPYSIRAAIATANVLKSGDTMSGDLDLGTHNITNAGNISATSLSGSLSPANISSGTANISITGSAVSFTGNLSGDVTGIQSNTTVARLRGVNVDSTAPTSGQVLKYDAANSRWTPGAPAASGIFPWQVVAGTSQQAQPNTGYIANNAAQVTITLPTGPKVGDIIRVSGAGAGGWKIAQNNGQYVTGTDFVPNTNTNWTARESNRSWESVASSADGTKLVAVVAGDFIYTSTDSGVTWIPRDSPRPWKAVASSADGTKLVAAANPGFIYTSTDSGMNWTQRAINKAWMSLASSSDGTKLVGVIQGAEIYTSTDSGVNWTPRDSIRSWWSVASSADGSKLVAVVGGGRIYTSTDSGVSWTPRQSNASWFSVTSSADGSKLVAAVFLDFIYTSTDSGVSWTQRDGIRQWISVASSADGSKLVAVVVNGQIYTSTDSGVNWIPRDSARNWSAAASSSDGNKLVATVSGGQIYTYNAAGNLATTVGTSGFLLGGQLTAIELQYIGNGQFLRLTHEGMIINQ